MSASARARATSASRVISSAMRGASNSRVHRDAPLVDADGDQLAARRKETPGPARGRRGSSLLLSTPTTIVWKESSTVLTSW